MWERLAASRDPFCCGSFCCSFPCAPAQFGYSPTCSAVRLIQDRRYLVPSSELASERTQPLHATVMTGGSDAWPTKGVLPMFATVEDKREIAPFVVVGEMCLRCLSGRRRPNRYPRRGSDRTASAPRQDHLPKHSPPLVRVRGIRSAHDLPKTIADHVTHDEAGNGVTQSRTDHQLDGVTHADIVDDLLIGVSR